MVTEAIGVGDETDIKSVEEAVEAGSCARTIEEEVADAKVLWVLLSFLDINEFNCS